MTNTMNTTLITVVRKKDVNKRSLFRGRRQLDLRRYRSHLINIVDLNIWDVFDCVGYPPI